MSARRFPEVPVVAAGAAAVVGCELHVLHAHAPVPLTFEQHHVIPQAWQLFAAGMRHVGPATTAASVPGAPPLFDPRTVGVGPTCHRNVHHYIVALMRALDALPRSVSRDVLTPEVTRLVRRRERVKVGSLHAAEFDTALLALGRYAAAGYELSALMDAGLWGEA